MLRIVPHTVPRVGRSYEHFPDGFELHLLPIGTPPDIAPMVDECYGGTLFVGNFDYMFAEEERWIGLKW